MLNCAEYVPGQYGAGELNIGGQMGMEIYNNTIQQIERPEGQNGWPIKYWNEGWLKGVKIYNNTLIKKPYGGSYPGESGWDFAIEFFNIQGLEIYGNTIQGSIDLNYNYKGAYAFCAWMCWMPNLAVAESWIRFVYNKKGRYLTGITAFRSREAV